MNKIEQAIRKTAHDGFFSSSLFSNVQTSCIEEISKMNNSFILSKDELRKKKIIYPSMKDSKLINSFRELRSTISSSNNSNVTMVAALGGKSGVSFFARNIASAIAFDTSKTSLLMDCNNRDSEVGRLFDLCGKPGVSEYVSNSSLNVEDIIYESGVERLRVIPFGDENIQVDEQYNHPRFRDLLDDIKNRYEDRNIIIDAPPILDFADSRLLLNLCDQVVIIIPYGKVSRQRLDEALTLIGREKFSGIVFNDHFN